MNDDKIAEIKAQHAIDERWRNGPSMLSPQSHDHRGYLLAEVERLRAALPYDWDMLQASRASLRDHMAEIKQVTRERDEARAEVERLRADAERFRWLSQQTSLSLWTDPSEWSRDGQPFKAWGMISVNRRGYPAAETLAQLVDTARADQEDGR